MNEIDKTKLTDQTKFRLEKITEIQNYFCQEINQRKLCIYFIFFSSNWNNQKITKHNKKQKEKA